MKNIYAIQPSNKHKAITAIDPLVWLKISAALNRKSFPAGMGLLDFGFPEIESTKGGAIPDISCIYISGALAFPQGLKESLFPEPSGLEFLPIQVSGEPWFLLNCRCVEADIDTDKSELMRGLNGEICFVSKVYLKSQQEQDVFVLDGSNRAQLFVTDAFKLRVEAMKLKGISFNKIGECV